MATRRVVPLRGVKLVGVGQPITLKIAKLVLRQEWIGDGFGGVLPGARSWTIQSIEDLPMQLLFAREQLTFECGGYSGRCFAVDSNTLQGTGSVAGLDWSVHGS